MNAKPSRAWLGSENAFSVCPGYATSHAGSNETFMLMGDVCDLTHGTLATGGSGQGCRARASRPSHSSTLAGKRSIRREDVCREFF